MIKGITAVLIWSQDFRKLATWYEEKLGLKPIEELDHPQDTGVLYRLGKVYFWIGQHSKVKGKNKDEHRIMFNIAVDSVTKVTKELKKKGVKFFAEPFKAPTMPEYFATFYDLDGNFVQLIGKK